MYVDPDNADPRVVAELVRLYENSAKRLREIVLHPSGASDAAKKFNQARAASQLSQVSDEITRLKKKAAEWVGPALEGAMKKGIKAGDRQAKEAGVRDSKQVSGSFSGVNHAAVQGLARDTVGDLFKAADSMMRGASVAVHRMAAAGVTNAEINTIVAGGIIEGQPKRTIIQLREALEKVHGAQVTIINKKGGEMTFDVDYYARMVANSKMRAVTVNARHAKLADLGLDLVKIVGLRSVNPCTLLLGKVFSLSGKSAKYPAFSTVSQGQLPYRLFHPNCSKATTPFLEGFSKAQTRGESAAEAA